MFWNIFNLVYVLWKLKYEPQYDSPKSKTIDTLLSMMLVMQVLKRIRLL